MTIPARFQPALRMLLLCIILWTVEDSFLVNEGNIRLGSTNKYINMKPLVAVVWVWIGALMVIFCPGVWCVVTMLMAIITSILSSIGNVPLPIKDN